MPKRLNNRFDGESTTDVPDRGVFTASLLKCRGDSLIEVSLSSIKVSDDDLEILYRGHRRSGKPVCLRPRREGD